LDICIIGLPKAGKTTVFNALTKGKSQTAAYAPSTLEPNIGIAKVKEPRLIVLERMFQPRKITLAEVKYTDIAIIPKGPGKISSISGEFLNYLSSANAILQIVRTFKDESIHHIEGSIDPKHDMSAMDLELSLSDLVIIERRLDRLETSLKSTKHGERDVLLKEQALLTKIKDGLNKEVPIWQQGLPSEETKFLSNYQFLTAKPMIVVINIGEDQLSQSVFIEGELRKWN